MFGLVTVLAVVSALLFAHFRPPQTIDERLGVCFGRSPAKSQTCLKSAVRSLLTEYSTKELMVHIVATSSPQSTTSRCHTVSHMIGEETLIKTGSLEQTLASCTAQCSYGCTHGAVAAEVARSFGEEYPGEEIAHADSGEIKSMGQRYCDRSFVMCHAIGHIARIASDSLEQSLQTCESVASGQALQTCFVGVFMEDVGLAAFAPERNTNQYSSYAYPCESLPVKYHSACFVQLPEYQKKLFDERSMSREEQINTAIAVCHDFEGPSRQECFFGFGYKLDRAVNENGVRDHDGPQVCDALEGLDGDTCMVGLAEYYGAMARYDDAIQLCDSRARPSTTQRCYDHVFENMGMSTDNARRMCAERESASCTSAIESYTARGNIPLLPGSTE